MPQVISACRARAYSVPSPTCSPSVFYPKNVGISSPLHCPQSYQVSSHIFRLSRVTFGLTLHRNIFFPPSPKRLKLNILLRLNVKSPDYLDMPSFKNHQGLITPNAGVGFENTVYSRQSVTKWMCR